MAFKFNPFTGKLDITEDDIKEVASAPTTGDPGTFYIDTSSPTDIYYFVGIHRYKLTGTLDDPTTSGGSDIFGLLLTRNLA